jgi:hypothetical protein
LPAIIVAVETNGIEKESVVIGAAIAQWFVIHKVFRLRLQEFRDEFGKQIWIAMMDQMETIDRNCGHKQASPRLGFGCAREQRWSLTLKGAAARAASR